MCRKATFVLKGGFFDCGLANILKSIISAQQHRVILCLPCIQVMHRHRLIRNLRGHRKPAWLIAEAESPPPIRENAPFFSVASTTASAMAFVPLAKFSNSNTPIGPFHRMVFEFFTTSANALIDSGPMSRPSQPSGISPLATTCVLASFENASAQRLSTGK